MNHETQRLIVWCILLVVPFLVWMIRPVRRYIPNVVLEIALGFALGPVILGQFWPEAFQYLFPNDVVTFITGAGFIAVMAFVYVTGLHIHVEEFPREQKKKIIIISFTSTLVPMIIGVPIAYLLAQTYPNLIGPKGTIPTFILSMGIAVSVSALPVLSAILYEMNEVDKPEGRFVLSVAVFHDALLWINLAVLLTLVKGQSPDGHAQHPIAILIETAIYAVIVLFGLRRILEKAVRSKWWENLPDTMKLRFQAVNFILSGLITHCIGIHFLIGTVLAGVAWPNHNRKPILKRIENFILAILLPLFFAAAGIKTLFNATSPEVWITFGVMSAATYLGQFLGTTIVLRVMKCPWNEALVKGIFLTCKGIAELVVLSLMHAEGIISDEAFAGMVLMAISVTGLTKVMVDTIRHLARKKLSVTATETAVHHSPAPAELAESNV